MRNLYLIMSLFLFFVSCSSAQDKTPMSQADCLSFFKDVKSPDGKKQLQMYSVVQKCDSYYSKNKELLKSLVLAYSELFKVNRSHNHLEPFMPYYLRNKTSFQALVKSLLDKSSADEFILRLDTAQREYLEGNG